ncbi:alginate lyase family protein [Microbacterium sp. USHLN186]|uniref:alginate lyase family protein n=1 Tax=Microbacterium sp. USHLN186 TaxID=3081286 RepID=UPI0030175609
MAAGFDGDAGREHTDRGKRNMSYQINSAYANALLYYYSGGKEKYAQNAIRMLNAYAHTFKGFASSSENSHVGDLFAAWMSQTLVRAAEIIRYTYSPTEGKQSFDVAAFESMLRTAFVPRLRGGTANINNWRTSAAEGLMNIGIFLDDRRLYERSLEIWREVTPAYIYLRSDGPRPASLLDGTDAQLDCRWADNRAEACKSHPKKSPGIMYQNGQNQEICRDMWHSSAGVGGIINAAETAFLQGDDLYAEEGTRIRTGLSYMIQLSQNVKKHGYPADFCAVTAGSGAAAEQGALPEDWDSTEPLSVVVAQNHYSNRLGVSFSSIDIPGYSPAREESDPIARYVKEYRSGPRDTYGYVSAWQVLTHSGIGEGVPASAEPLPPPAPGTPDAHLESRDKPTGVGGILIIFGIASIVLLTVGLLRLALSANRRDSVT